MTQTKNIRLHLDEDDWSKIRVGAALSGESVTEYLTKLVKKNIEDIEVEISNQTRMTMEL